MNLIRLASRGTRMNGAAVILAAVAVASGCSKKHKQVAVPVAPAAPTATAAAKHGERAPSDSPAPVPAPRAGDVEEGIASWYGYPYHGRRAANGEIYDMEKMTAAHRTLPFDTWVDVENLTNGKTATVRITDRGPFVDGRIIDLSHAAARQIDMIGPGVSRVRLQIVAPPPPSEPVTNLFAVQVGAFQDRDRAERVMGDFEQEFQKVRIVRRPGKPDLWRVLVGAEPSQQAAEALAQKVRLPGRPAFVVRLDEPAGDPSGSSN